MCQTRRHKRIGNTKDAGRCPVFLCSVVGCVTDWQQELAAFFPISKPEPFPRVEERSVRRTALCQLIRGSSSKNLRAKRASRRNSCMSVCLLLNATAGNDP